MTPATREKLQQLREQFEELTARLADPRVIADHAQFRKLSIELAEIQPLVELFDRRCATESRMREAAAMTADADRAIRQLAREESAQLTRELDELDASLQQLLLPKPRGDERDVFLEIRAGTGGFEAALFAGDLFKMYYAYAERENWRVEILNRNAGEHGGYKEIISRITGTRAHAKLKFESGAHRVQRVPETESQGRVHTSACTVAVLPEAGESDEITVNPGDIRVDTFRASGAGGQHVNKTDSAIRITHLPSGIVVECQDQRSQHKNRARALAVLTARLLEAQTRARQREEDQLRKSLVGSGDRSERIRTYNFPQGRVTDHRIGLTVYKLDDILAGRLEHMIEPLTAAHQAAQLAR